MFAKILGGFVILLLLVAGGIFLTNPNEKLKEERDKKRISDLKILEKALDYYISKNAKNGSPLCDNCALGSEVFSYRPLTFSGRKTQVTQAQFVNGHGWLPVDLSLNAPLNETPLKLLPVDPKEDSLEVRKKIPFINKQITQKDLEFIYTFTPGADGKYKLTAKMESKMGLEQASNDGGTLNDRYEIGEVTLAP